MVDTVIVTEVVNDVVVSSPGPQGPRGKTILNGNGVPAENLGLLWSKANRFNMGWGN
jgi:hypothetical protein